MSGAGRGQCEVLESNPFAHGGKAWRGKRFPGEVMFNSDGVFTNATFFFWEIWMKILLYPLVN